MLGGFDEFTAIRAVIDKHNATLEAPKKIWMHVDGAWGGSLAMSDRPELRALISGVELADSVLWNFHKGMGLPIFASALLTNNRPRALEASNQSCAECALPPASTVHQSWICLGNEMLLMCLHLAQIYSMRRQVASMILATSRCSADGAQIASKSGCRGAITAQVALQRA